jgi:hypothetical protein
MCYNEKYTHFILIIVRFKGRFRDISRQNLSEYLY